MYNLIEKTKIMKKIISLLLALSLVCCVPTIFAAPFGMSFMDMFREIEMEHEHDEAALMSLDDVGDGVTFGGYCSNCGRETSCEDYYDTYYFPYDDDEHYVHTDIVTVCTECSSIVSVEFYDEITEPCYLLSEGTCVCVEEDT